MKRVAFVLAAAVACASLGSAAQAATITGLFATGVDDSGNVLAEGAVDSHWVVNGATQGIVYDNALYNLPADARFIGQLPGGDYSTNPNTYSTTFTVSGDLSTANLSGLFEADNFASIYLNGHLLAADIPATVYENFQTFTSFSASADDFVADLNTLSVVLTDTGKPSAMLVSGLVTTRLTGVVPEPATWALMIGGFGMAGAALRRRRQSAAATA